MKRHPIVLLALIIFPLMLVACGRAPESGVSTDQSQVADSGDTKSPPEDSIVHGRAMVVVGSEQSSPLAKLMNALFLPATAFASSSGSTTVTYTNAGSTNFTIDVSSLVAGSQTDSTLSLGSFTLASLKDNNLKVCGSNGNSQCAKAAIRVYTTGSIAGFVNTADGYGAPLFVGTLNSSSQVGLNAASSVQVQTLTIGASKHTVALADFPSPTYAASSDFSNAGAGNYSMTFVVEYALSQ